MDGTEDYSNRIIAIRNGPFSWKEKDILTAAEIYLEQVMDFSLIKMLSPYFSRLSPDWLERIDLVWKFQIVAFHLKRNLSRAEDTALMQALSTKASTIYELEAQRLLGSIFVLEDDFWKIFYKRQEVDLDKALLALDALHFASSQQQPLIYQLLLQTFREIIKGQYSLGKTQKTHFENAKRLLIDLPLPQLQQWLNQQLRKVKSG